jgi:hypothetical protein
MNRSDPGRTRGIRDIDDFDLSEDARRLYDWMIAAFTGDINDAMADAERYGAWPSRWPRERVRKAHDELKTAGVLSAEAPDLSPSRSHSTRKKKSSAQLDADIAEVLASQSHATMKAHSTVKCPSPEHPLYPELRHIRQVAHDTSWTASQLAKDAESAFRNGDCDKAAKMLEAAKRVIAKERRKRH